MTDPAYLLDTDTLSALIRDPSGPVRDRLATVGEAAMATSVIVAGELVYGATRRGSARLTARVEALLGTITVLPFRREDARRYGALRADLESRGTTIGGNDMLIAAQALAAGLVMVTGNEREFTRVPGLVVENWLALGQK